MAKREKLGHRLKRVRIARDLSLRETASKVGVSPTYLSRVENCLDPSPPTEKTLRALADVLGDNFDELMQLAGRVPEDVEKLIKADPDMPVMLRRAREQNVTGAELLEWLETKKKGGQMIPELKVPFLHEKQVERAANELLHKYAKDKGKPVRAPIDVENILEGYFELDLVYIDLPDFIGVPDVLGATFIKDQRVFIDESLMIEGKEGRLAFTLAHEGGHWYLHRPLIEMEQVTATLFGKDDVPKQPTIFCRSSQKKAPAEWQADRFAAALLMPAADVRATVRALCGDTLPTWEDVEAKRKARVLDEKLRDLATEVMTKGNFTNVSNEAMRYRLLDLNLVLDASNPQRSLL